MLATEEARPGGAAMPEGGRLYGVIDVIRPNKIAGWAVDRADPRAALDIDVMRDGRPVERIRADRLRRDLQASGLGTGLYGFSATIDPPVEPGFEFTVGAVARAADGTTAELKRAGSAAAAEDPGRRLLEALYLRLRELDRTVGAARAEDFARLEDLLLRVELAQSRLEQSLERAVPEGGARRGGLVALVALSLALGLGSLAVGLLSMLQP